MTPGTLAYQAPVQILQAKILNGLPFPSPGSFPDPGIEPGSLTFQADSLPSVPPGKPYLYKFFKKTNTEGNWLELTSSSCEL